MHSILWFLNMKTFFLAGFERNRFHVQHLQWMVFSRTIIFRLGWACVFNWVLGILDFILIAISCEEPGTNDSTDTGLEIYRGMRLRRNIILVSYLKVQFLWFLFKDILLNYLNLGWVSRLVVLLFLHSISRLRNTIYQEPCLWFNRR